MFILQTFKSYIDGEDDTEKASIALNVSFIVNWNTCIGISTDVHNLALDLYMYLR